MRPILVLLLLAFFIYMVSFTVHNWVNKNKLAAVGGAILTLTATAVPVYCLFFFR